ncbi:MAG TPA: MASE1 domain-containing protein, partial [Thermoanaerobaculia bacterium]|nr:MASE1 domain-containing protein [Thermoanaerobaculia bacterium]
MRPWLPEVLSPTSLALALAVAILYLGGMKVGSALTAPGQPISTLWPPNALLMAALLVAPRRLWPLFLAVLLPAHVLFQRQLGLPLAASLGWFVGNTGEALLGAAFLRRSGSEEPIFRTVRCGIRFILYAGLLAPLLTSFLDAGVVIATGLAPGYWSPFFTRLLSNIVAILLFVPPVVLAFEGGVAKLFGASVRRRAEAAALAAATVLSCVVADSLPSAPYTLMFEVCAPLFCLLWAAWRFGPFESSLAILTVTLVEVWHSIHGRGPFGSGLAAENVLLLQAYSATITIPLLLFALAVRERRRADRRLRRNEARLSLSMAVARLANWDFDLATGEVTLSENRVGFLPARLDPDLPLLFAVVHADDREEVLRVHEEAVRRCGSYEVECRVFDEAGRLRWVHRKGQVICDDSGKPVRVLGVTREITEQKENQKALAEAQKISVLARTAARMVIWSVNVETGELYTDPELPSLLGFERGAKGRSLDVWLGRIYEPDRSLIATIRDSIVGISADGRREIEIPELEYRMQHADGSLRWFLARATVERSPDGSTRRIVGTAMDVTDRKKAELEAVEQRQELMRLARVT